MRRVELVHRALVAAPLILVLGCASSQATSTADHTANEPGGASGAGGSGGGGTPNVNPPPADTGRDASAPRDAALEDGPVSTDVAPEASAASLDAGEAGTAPPPGSFGGPTGKLLPCAKAVPAVFNKGVGNAGECDWPQTSLDFEEDAKASKTLPTGSWQISNWGKAFTKSEINGCHPYCYDSALVVGIDIVGDGTPEASRGEVLIDYAPSVAPFTPSATAPKGYLLAWFFVEGPGGTPLTVQLETRNKAGKGAAYPANGGTTEPGKWLEFKASPLEKAFPAEALTDLIGIRVKVWANPPLPAGKEWHGRINMDHIEIGDRLTGTARP